MKPNEEQKAVLLAIWYGEDEWCNRDVYYCTGLKLYKFYEVARELAGNGWVEVRKRSPRKEGVRFEQTTTVTEYRITKDGQRIVDGMLIIIDGNYKGTTNEGNPGSSNHQPVNSRRQVRDGQTICHSDGRTRKR